MMTFTTRKYRDDSQKYLPLWHKELTKGFMLVPKLNVSTISHALIIQGPMSVRAIESARANNITPVIIESFNYMDRIDPSAISPSDYNNLEIKNVFASDTYNNQEWCNHVRLRARLTHNQVCRILNHMAAWSVCMQLTTPCIVMEHNSILLSPKIDHIPKSSIHCLSNNEPFFLNSNWACMGEPFAYSVDCHSAKRLFNKVMIEGIIDPIEYMIRTDEFMIVFGRQACRINYADSSAATLDSKP